MNWENLMDSLTSGEIVPVIGNDLSLVKENNGDFIPLYEYFARETAQYYKISDNNLSIHELTLCHQKYKTDNISPKVKAIYNKLKSEKNFFTDPLTKLAKITDFKYYISTSIDDLLVDAIRNERHIAEGELNVIDYSLIKKAKKHAKHNVTIFRLMGSLNDLANYAIDEEKMLEHIYSISSREYHDHPQVKELIDRIKDKIFLFIGCDFPDWFMRFLMRILTNRRLNNMGFKDYVINKSSKHPEKLMNFLTHCGKDFVVINNGDNHNAIAFVDQLYQQWIDVKMSKRAQFEGTVFISYFHENQQDAEYLKEKLDAEGIRVWFDKSDLGAGKHKDIIEKAIMKECNIFVPLISNEILDNPDCYARDVEWKAAEQRSNVDRHRGEQFTVIPCITDNTDSKDNRITSFLKALTVYKLKTAEERLINEIKKNLKPIITE
ncbi:MAG: toll/interleukin-1 receptor domain-containing protein [Candidatus Aminicenantes bacterium]|nr:toll/interleukin-1 receptor domain-containing protein [Candidatus Aminicenantes bacterium]